MSFFVHATEDSERVMKAVQNVVSADFVENILFKKSTLKGDYGNPILFFKARIEEKENTEPVLKRIFSRLSAWDRERLLRNLSLHLEKGNLYIRLGKQAAFRGDLALCTEDPIHLRFRFRERKKEEIIKICKDFGL